MQPPGTPKSDGTGLEQLWRQVCASRGTPAPDPARLARFMEDLETHAREKLQSVLLLAARGREPPGELSLLSWAAACTRPALLGQLQSCGLAFTSAGLFACGLALREKGWDMQHRIAQLAGNPADVDTLRAWLPAVLPLEAGQAEEDPPKEAEPHSPEDRSVDAPFFPWPDDADDHGLPGDPAPGWEEEPMDEMPDAAALSNLSAALPVLPTRFARQRSDALAGPVSAQPPRTSHGCGFACLARRRRTHWIPITCHEITGAKGSTAQLREHKERTAPGICVKAFQASQQASTICS